MVYFPQAAPMSLNQAKYNSKKFKELVLYVAQQLGGEIRGKKRLAKLLYFVDFDYFEKYEQPVTGSTYRALPMGPFPSELPEAIRELESDGSLATRTDQEWGEGYEPTIVYHAKREPDLSVFSKDEVAMADRVIGKYRNLTGTELETLSHSQAPFVGTKPGEDIAYELSFYRETDFNDV